MRLDEKPSVPTSYSFKKQGLKLLWAVFIQ
jgi:hypothetical protein